MSEEEISIKVNIGDRFYPLKVLNTQEESIRKAAKRINEKVKLYVANYSLQDKQDALSMVSLELATEKNESSPGDQNLELINSKIQEIEQLLAD